MLYANGYNAMKTHSNIRKIEFDIFKGLMIISVVIGHTDATIPYINVFWFHMPAFFLVSGYLTADWRLDKNSWKKKIKKFVIPYITYSILLYIIFQPEPIIKNIARTIYAGRYNITVYSYPFWFINSLLVVNVAYCLMNKFLDNRLLTLVKWGGVNLYYSDIICVACYLLIHTSVFHLLPIPLPWGIDAAIGAFVFFYIGDKWNISISNQRWVWWSILFIIIFIAINHCCNWEYKINMKAMTYNHIILDLLVPTAFIFIFLQISKMLEHVPFISSALAYTGKCSMTIYFLHAALLYVMKSHVPIFMNISITISLGVFIHYILNH